MKHLEKITREEPINDDSRVYSKENVISGSLITSLTGFGMMGVAAYEKRSEFLYAGLGMALSSPFFFAYTTLYGISKNQDNCHTNGETSPNSATNKGA